MALALLLGQFGAEVHAYSHLSNDALGIPDTTQGCRTCLSFAPLSSAVGGSQSAAVLPPCVAEAIDPFDTISISLSPVHPAFQSRAPPTLL